MVNAVQKAACLLLALIVLGCSDEKERPEPPPSVFGDNTPLSTPGLETIEFGIGDVETTIDVVLTVDPETDQTNVTFQEFLTRKKEIAKVEVHVSKPYPDKLLLKLAIRCFDEFPEHAVQVLPHIFVGGKDVLSYGLIFGINAHRERPTFSFDIMEHLEEYPPRVIVHAETYMNLFMDTDMSDITVETPLADPRNTIRKLTSPVIIFFEE